jgi:hypothetical protein
MKTLFSLSRIDRLRGISCTATFSHRSCSADDCCGRKIYVATRDVFSSYFELSPAANLSASLGSSAT